MPTLEPLILHVDDALIVVAKPAGLPSVPGQGEDRQDCLERRIRARFDDALSVHRLDMATSGVMLMARGPDMQRTLNRDFQQRTIGKRYVAVVRGHMPADAGEIDLPLGKDREQRPREKVDPVHGRPARTRYRVLLRAEQAGEAVTRVELEPLTGRTHQLRVHLLSVGHPILGDPLYGDQATGRHPGRLHLHAAEISLFHPRTRRPLRFGCPEPF